MRNSRPAGTPLRQAFAELYEACGSPAPRVIEAKSHDAFIRLTSARHTMQIEFEIVLMCTILSVMYSFVTAYEVIEKPSEGIPWLSLALTFITAVPFLFNLVNQRRSPDRWAADATRVTECLHAAGCWPEISGPVSWSAEQSARPVGEHEINGTVSRLAAKAYALVDMAILADGRVLVIRKGVLGTRQEAPPEPIALTDRDIARATRLSLRLDPSEAQVQIEKLGIASVFRALRSKPFAADTTGTLWQLEQPGSRQRLRWLQVADPATGSDAWIAVPNHLPTPREAVAWTYGMGPEAYSPTLEG